MKTIGSGKTKTRFGLVVAALCATSLGTTGALAGSSPDTTQSEEPSFNNWITPAMGGLIITGSQAQFQQANPTTGPVNGGIQDMHYQQDLGNKTTLKLDGHALFDNGDYKINLEINKDDLGYFKAGYTGFTSYFNGNGGFLPATATFYRNGSTPVTSTGSANQTLPGGLMINPGSEYSLYRGSLWAELGLRKEGLPELTFHYEHDIRNGQEDSTSWGYAYVNSTQTNNNPYNVGRKIAPAFWNLNETRDIFNLSGKQLIGKPDAYGNTEVNLNLRYELNRQDDQLNTQSYPGAAPSATNGVGIRTPNAIYNTQTQQLSLDNYSGNISTVTRFGEKVWVTTGYSYANVSSSLGGSSISGPNYNSSFSPLINNVWYGGARGISSEYLNLGGGSTIGQNIALLNVMWAPIDGLTITPSARYECNDTAGNSTFLGVTAPPTTTAQLKTNTGLNPASTVQNSTVLLNDFTEGLDVKFTKLKNWVLYGSMNLDQQFENRAEWTPDNSSSSYTANALNLNANNAYRTQKLLGGVNWYPLANLTAGAQFYWQYQSITQSLRTDDPVYSNQRLLNQQWNTQGANFRLTYNPFSTLSLVSKYDLMKSTINSSWAGDPLNGQYMTPSGPSSVYNTQAITESATWTPVNRLFLQGNLAYILNQIVSPNLNTPGVTAANNNYWTAGLGAGYQIDNKTEFRTDFTYYFANDYQNIAAYGVPYGAGATQYTVSATLKRQITRNINWDVKYYFDSYHDILSGGYNSYVAQVIATSITMKF